MLLLDQSELRASAGRCEREEGAAMEMKAEAVAVLDGMLRSVCSDLRPKQEDYDKRTRIVKMTEEMVKEAFGEGSYPPSVQIFGSFVMDLFTATSDLDLSINFSDGDISTLNRYEKIKLLKKMVRILGSYQRQERLSKVTPILSARVPIVKFMDDSKIECDISVENKDGVRKSYIISLLSSIDGRFQMLCLLMKAWAKAQGINSAMNNTLSSIVIILLVAFHLQTRNPPILPPLSAVLQDATDEEELRRAVHQFKDFGSENIETIAELFVSLLNKLFSVKALWKHGLCASTYDASWISKLWESGIACVSVEDFVDRTQNCARAVREKSFGKIYACISRALNQWRRFLIGTTTLQKLKNTLFGSMDLHTGEALKHVPKKIKKKKVKVMRSRVVNGRDGPAGAVPSQVPATVLRENTGPKRSLPPVSGSLAKKVRPTLQPHQAANPRPPFQSYGPHSIASPLQIMGQMADANSLPAASHMDHILLQMAAELNSPYLLPSLYAQQQFIAPPALALHYPHEITGTSAHAYRPDYRRHHEPSLSLGSRPQAFASQAPWNHVSASNHYGSQALDHSSIHGLYNPNFPARFQNEPSLSLGSRLQAFASQAPRNGVSASNHYGPQASDNSRIPGLYNPNIPAQFQHQHPSTMPVNPNQRWGYNPAEPETRQNRYRRTLQ